MFKVVIGALILIALIGCSSTPGSISGHAYSPLDDGPLAGVSVQLEGPNSVEYFRTTDSEGKYEVNSVEIPGLFSSGADYNLRADYFGKTNGSEIHIRWDFKVFIHSGDSGVTEKDLDSSNFQIIEELE